MKTEELTFNSELEYVIKIHVFKLSNSQLLWRTQKAPRLDSNLGPSCCGATALTSPPLCCLCGCFCVSFVTVYLSRVSFTSRPVASGIGSSTPTTLIRISRMDGWLRAEILRTKDFFKTCVWSCFKTTYLEPYIFTKSSQWLKANSLVSGIQKALQWKVSH